MFRTLSRSRSFLAASGLFLALGSTSALDARERESKSIVDLSFPLTALAALGGNITLDCDSDGDREMRQAMRSLERQGIRGRFEWSEDDGDRMVATRDGARFRLYAKESDGDAVTLEMPWRVAQCLLGGKQSGKTKIQVADLRRDGGFRLKVNGEDANVNLKLN